MHAISDRFHTGRLVCTLAADTQIGNRYAANFDVLAVRPDRQLVVVADGMGGGEGSAVAGRTAVDTFLSCLTPPAGGVAGSAQPAGDPASPEFAGIAGLAQPAQLREAVAQAQRRVRAAGARLGELTGCTLTALVGAGEAAAWIVHIGDSRGYRLRGGVLELLTTDHTEAWPGLLYGWYPADSHAAEVARHRLHRYVGHPAEPEPDLLHLSLRSGDVLCLCTDGVAEQVAYQRLGQVLAAVRDGAADPAGAVAALLADTLAAGGRDNATLAVLCFSPRSTTAPGSAP